MEFIDRKSAYPNRYTLTDENGNVSYVVIERADEPIIPGTPLNAETFSRMYEGVESEEHSGCYYRAADDKMEWINPPMLPDVEYRTTERYNGKPVYAKRIVFDMSTMSNNFITVNAFPGECQCVDIRGVLSHLSISYTLPCIGDVNAWLTVDKALYLTMPDEFPNAQINLKSTTDLSGCTAECTVKYVKG